MDEKKVLHEIEELKDKKGYLKAGQPVFNRLFGRDSIIAAWELLEYDPKIARATLDVLSKLQGKEVNYDREEEPGKIIHETEIGKKKHPDMEMPFPYYGAVDSTPLYLMLVGLYFDKTHDLLFIDKHWNNVILAVEWLEKYGDADGDYFLEYHIKNPNGLFHQCWKDNIDNHLGIEPPVAIVEVQGYQYLALGKVADIAETRGENVLAEKLRRRAGSLKKRFNKEFWMKDEKYFALALDGEKKQKKTVTSNPGHLFFTGIIDDEKVDLVVKRLFQKDLFTSCGIRTHSSLEPDFHSYSYHKGAIWPFDNWVIAQGLRKLGYEEEYQRVKGAIVNATEKMGYLPEFYRVSGGKIVLDPKNPLYKNKACYPQAWSSGALLSFLQNF